MNLICTIKKIILLFKENDHKTIITNNKNYHSEDFQFFIIKGEFEYCYHIPLHRTFTNTEKNKSVFVNKTVFNIFKQFSSFWKVSKSKMCKCHLKKENTKRRGGAFFITLWWDDEGVGKRSIKAIGFSKLGCVNGVLLDEV